MVQLQKDLIREMLKDVMDPELGINIVDLGLVYDVNISEVNDVEVVMALTSMGCPLGPVITGEVSNALSGLMGIGDTSVKIVWSPPWSPDKMSEDARDELGIW
jgi:metal-sulfur cluster biosynthetic enzyme